MGVERLRKEYSPLDIKKKVYAYCAYQERSHQEVKRKLADLGMYGDQAEQLLTNLITEGYLNEERFAKAFAGGKFRIKSWGRVKIAKELEAHGLTKNCIHSGLLEINAGDYREALEKLIRKKSRLLRDEDVLVRRDKLARHAISKGYESDIVWKTIDEVVGR